MKTVYDLEESIYYRQSRDSRSREQRAIRRVLRKLDLGVGRGNTYSWTSREFDKILGRVREALPQ